MVTEATIQATGLRSNQEYPTSGPPPSFFTGEAGSAFHMFLSFYSTSSQFRTGRPTSYFTSCSVANFSRAMKRCFKDSIKSNLVAYRDSYWFCN